MFHFCVFGAYEGNLAGGKKFYVTICGGSELKKPTLARQIVEARQRRQLGLPRREHFIVTICGATEVKAPTLAEEYLEMRDAVSSGLISIDEWDEAVARLAGDESVDLGSFTVCGACETSALPGENEEVEGLALQRHLGQIPDSAGRALELGVGQAGAQRTAILRQAIAGSMTQQMA